LKSIVLMVSHCLLNKSTRWWHINKPIERNMGLVPEIVEFASKNNLGLIQMPCPEFTFCGNPRPSRTKDEYEALPGFKEHCENLARFVVEQAKTLLFMGRNPSIHILAIIGVKRSPSCAINSALRKISGEIQCTNEEGIFMESLRRGLFAAGLNPHFLEFDFDRPDEIISDLKRILGEIRCELPSHLDSA